MTRRGAYQVGQPGVALGTLGQRIRAIRKAWGWTQRELAAHLHVPQNSVSQWEGDRTRPIGPVLAHLLRIFGLSEGALVDGTGFTIPDLIGETRRESMLVMPGEGQAGRMLALPSVSNGEIWRIELRGHDAGSECLTLQQANRYLKDVVKGGGSVWIIARPA